MLRKITSDRAGKKFSIEHIESPMIFFLKLAVILGVKRKAVCKFEVFPHFHFQFWLKAQEIVLNCFRFISFSICVTAKQ